jgi:ubiquinone/menaquinone biosynthesis C-methylase UbiE
VRRPLRAFISINKTICKAIEGRLPQRRLDLPRTFDEVVATQMTRLRDGAVVVDVGSGKECLFARHRPRDRTVRIIGVDASDEELIDNDDVDEKRVADITESLPFDRAAVDLLASRSVLEHLSSTERFIAESARVVKPGGYSIHLCASRFAPFAVLNRFLPSRISQRLLDTFHPECRGRLGFRTYYDRTYASGLREMLERNGFDLVDLKVSYYQSGYYNFFVPLYVLSALYELVLYIIRVDDLAAKLMVVGRKRVTPLSGTAASNAAKV